MNQIFYTRESRNDLRKLDLPIAQRIINKINFFLHQPNPLKFAKQLTNSDLGAWRFRIGAYRVIFDIDKKGDIHILMILRIKHRKDIYDIN